MSGNLLLSGALGLALAAGTLAQNSTTRSDNPRSDNPRGDPNNAASTDLATQGGPGFVNNPATRGPYNLPDPKISDRQFLERAVMRGLTQVEIGKLALEKASSDAIRAFGKKMVDDHTHLNARLGRLAGKEGMPVPGSLDSRHQARVDRLAKLSGVEFDRAYIKDQIKSQQRDADAFELESQEGADAAVRDFALKMIPAVQQHLQMIKDLDKGKTTAKK